VTRPILLALAAACALGVRAPAMFVRPDVEDVPVDRIIANLSRQLAAAPRDAALHARLARVHAIAYAQHIEQFPVDRQTRQPFFGYGPDLPPKTSSSPRTPAMRRHLADALTHYRQSLELDPNDQVVRLGYGWALEQSGDVARAKTEYRTIIEKAWPKERERKYLAPGEVSLAVEAGSYLRPRLDPVADAAEIEAIDAREREIARRPRAVTPIAIPLDADLTADRLVDPAHTVMFDADGSGVAKRWTWLTPGVAWLVHDPRGTGEVTSALRLFGTVTFWMFWRDGYEALAALDDNGDGELHGTELAGLALWRDLNGDGRTNDGEVQPLGSHGIVAVSCRARRLDHDAHVAAWSPDGVSFADGTRRSSYDVFLRAPAALTH
jgi:hypothetical protein